MSVHTQSILFMLLFIVTGVFMETNALFLKNVKSKTPMLDMLDAMQQLMTGSGQFDRNFYNDLRSCMNTFDPRLPSAQDAAWQGIIDYWDMGGAPEDPWGLAPKGYFECNITETTVHNMKIYEPCNYVSNIAHYHSLLEICKRRSMGRPFSLSDKYIKALGDSIATMVTASGFMHGSNTLLGAQQDTVLIQVIGYLIHQGSLSSLSSRSSILHDLSNDPKQLSAIDLSNAMQNMYISEPVVNWYNITESLQLPNFFLSFGGIIGTALHMSFAPRIVDKLLSRLVEAFALPEDDQIFLIQSYLPELRRATTHLNRNSLRRSKILSNSVGTILKVSNGFLWQEKTLIRDRIIFKPSINSVGSKLIFRLNRKINKLTTFEYFNPQFQHGKNVYPGEEWCNPVFPHAKWHVQSALGMLDMAYLADEMNRLLRLT